MNDKAPTTKPLVDGAPFTIDFVLEKLRESDPHKLVKCTTQNLLHHSIENITCGKAFMSQIHKLTFTWKEPGIFPQSVILKVPGYNNVSAGMFDDDRAPQQQKDVKEVAEASEANTANTFLEFAHSREIIFYQTFSHYDPQLKLPKLFYGYEFNMKHNKGLIIMEDMTPVAKSIPMIPGVDEAHVASMISEIARFHCASWTHRDWLEKMPNGPSDKGFLDEMRTMTARLKQIDPARFDDLIDAFLPLYTMRNCSICTYADDRYGFPPCVIHGDLWAPNVLWRIDTNGEPTSEVSAIIDWQMIHAGNPAEDLARYLAINTTHQYRRENTDRLLKLYAAKVSELSHRKVAPFTLENLQLAYQDAMLPVAMFLGFGAPMYHNMDSVVGKEGDSDREAKQSELLDRVKAFIEDTLVYHKDKIA